MLSSRAGQRETLRSPVVGEGNTKKCSKLETKDSWYVVPGLYC